MQFRAIRANRSDSGVTTELVMLDDSDLDVGDVTVRVDYSTINYKDGLAITNASPVIQRFPLIPGIDLAGTVEASDSAEFAAGDKVVLNGWGLSQTHDGGFAQKARVPADWLIKLPAGIDTRHAAAIGTAGYTAMLSVLALEHGGVTPDVIRPAILTP
jgi:acrylyl-CoA reductase (NADPH)